MAGSLVWRVLAVLSQTYGLNNVPYLAWSYWNTGIYSSVKVFIQQFGYRISVQEIELYIQNEICILLTTQRLRVAFWFWFLWLAIWKWSTIQVTWMDSINSFFCIFLNTKKYIFSWYRLSTRTINMHFNLLNFIPLWHLKTIKQSSRKLRASSLILYGKKSAHMYFFRI